MESVPDGYKRCTKCGEVKAATSEHFHRDAKTKSGFVQRCKLCALPNVAEQRWLRKNSSVWRPWGFKFCVCCQTYKPVSEFGADKKLKDGLRSYCKTCHCQVENERRRADPWDAVKQRARYDPVKQKVRYEFTKEADRPRRLRVAARVRERNREKIRAADRAYKKANPEKVAARNRNRRARKKGAGGQHTAADVAAQLLAQKGLCYYCETELNGLYHIDHYIPLCKGGSNGPENIVIACPFCNMSKGVKMPDEFRREHLSRLNS